MCGLHPRGVWSSATRTRLVPAEARVCPMPIYEFHCEKCKADFDQLFRTMDANPRARCPKCGGAKTQRKLSLFGMSVGKSRGEPARATSRSGCSSCARSSCAGCRR